jgi:hypothetical protein
METSKVIHMKLAGAELIVGPGARLPDGIFSNQKSQFG